MAQPAEAALHFPDLEILFACLCGNLMHSAGRWRITQVRQHKASHFGRKCRPQLLKVGFLTCFLGVPRKKKEKKYFHYDSIHKSHNDRVHYVHYTPSLIQHLAKFLPDGGPWVRILSCIGPWSSSAIPKPVGPLVVHRANGWIIVTVLL